MTDCPFCPVPEIRVIYESELTIGFWDGFPVSPGHALIIPRRHVPSWSEASPEERRAVADTIEIVRKIIDERHHPAGYNIGFNEGIAAGQTVMHLHVHVIPRYEGDVPDPRGGVRWVVSNTAKYWKPDHE